MSTNTQEQGRTIFSERGFTFTAAPGEDAQRTMARWERALQEQLYTGDVTHDALAKQVVMNAMQPAPDAQLNDPVLNPTPAPSA